MTQVPLAARGPVFAEDLGRLGINVTDPPSLMDVAAAISAAVDRHAREHGGRTDLGEMAQMAAVESLTAMVAPTLPSLFGPSPEEVQRAIGRLAGGDRFCALAREFFARLTQRTLDYYLSRELSNHIGAGERFETTMHDLSSTRPSTGIAGRHPGLSKSSRVAGTARTSTRARA